MTEEQLKRGKELTNEIREHKELLTEVQASISLMMAWENNGYTPTFELPKEWHEKVKAGYAKELQDHIDELQKQFDEL